MVFLVGIGWSITFIILAVVAIIGLITAFCTGYKKTGWVLVAATALFIYLWGVLSSAP